MSASAMRQHALLNSTPVGEQADTVSTSESNFRKAESSIDRKIEFAQAPDPRAHQPAGVNDQPDRLAAFDLEHARDQLASPCGGRPTHVAQFVSIAIFAQ